MRPSVALLFAAIQLVGCGSITLNPVVSDVRVVRPIQDPSRTVKVTQGMVFYNARPATRGVRFPPGTYVLEAEDNDYLYLRSPKPLELRVFRDSVVVDAKETSGGIMLRKTAVLLLAGGGYIDGDGGTKIMVWKLGTEFLELQGRYWTKSF